MNYCLLYRVVVISLLSYSANAKVIDPANYDFPIRDSMRASISTLLLKPTEQTTVEIQTPVLRRDLGQIAHRFRKHRDLRTLFYPTNNDSNTELTFVLAGLGSDTESDLAQFLAAHTQKAGRAALIVPNTFTANFIISSSPFAMPADARSDAYEVYETLKHVLNDLGSRGHNFKKISLVGYSYGALLAAHLVLIDQIEKAFNFNSVLLMNPPIDLYFGVRALDNIIEYSNKVSLLKKLAASTALKKTIDSLKKQKLQDEVYSAFDQSWDSSPDDAKALIGHLFKSLIAPFVLATQEVEDFGILPPRLNQGTRKERENYQARKRAAKRFNFESYTDTFYRAKLLSLGIDFSLDETNKRSSLSTIAVRVMSLPQVSLVHNEDDFLIKREEARWLSDQFPDRTLIYPSGGHLGNAGFSKNLAAYQHWIQTGQLFASK